jgi:hypothetical protein
MQSTSLEHRYNLRRMSGGRSPGDFAARSDRLGTTFVCSNCSVVTHTISRLQTGIGKAADDFPLAERQNYIAVVGCNDDLSIVK